MLREATETGNTVQEALEAACKKLGVTRDEVQFEILQMASKKALGLFGGSLAKVRVYIEDTPARAATQYLKEILSAMNMLDYNLEVTENEGSTEINISGDDVGFIIGHHGETLDALQYLVGLVANKKGEDYHRVSINVGDYREKREKALIAIATKMAKQSVKNRRNYHFEPMNPYERRIIHTAIQNVDGATSWSIGESTSRHVVVGPKKKDSPKSSRSKSKSRSAKPAQTQSPLIEQDNPFALKPSQKVADAPVGGSTSSGLRPPVRNKDLNSTPLYGRIDLDK